jgi:uncharacterized membrane-anchored protein
MFHWKKFIFFLVIYTLFAVKVSALDRNIPTNPNELSKKIESLRWVNGPKAITFDSANAKINVRSGSGYLSGEDARQYMYWVNGTEYKNVEHLIETTNATYTYSFYKVGKVPNDFKDLNADQLLKSMIDSLPTQNSKRAQAGLATATNIKWFQKPFFDEKNHAAFYSYAVDWSDASKTVQSSVLLLGRAGYTSVTVMVDAKSYSRENIILAIDTFGYNKEQEYTAWRQGDLVAAAGVAGLVAASAGGKAVVAASKGLWKSILAGIVALGALIVGFFSKKK